MPILLPSSWFQVLMEKYEWLLCGGPGHDIHEEFGAFWSLYERVQPNHRVFEKTRAQLRCTVPVLVHGDEGRYVKKGNFMVCTIECILGSDPKKRAASQVPCACHTDPVLARYHVTEPESSSNEVGFLQTLKVASAQQANDSGNEFLSKFLLFGCSSIVYRKNKGLLKQAFSLVSDDLAKLLQHGLTVGDKTFFFACLGVKGDLKFHHQMAGLTRSYFNVGTKSNHCICSLCLAGDDRWPFEDVRDAPVWAPTMHQERPWRDGETPSLAEIPFEDSCPEAIFRLDLFHCWKCGLGRDLTGSTLVILLQLGYFDFGPDDATNFPERLDRSHSCFRLWAIANSKSPALHSFSRSLLNYLNERCFAWFNVKGSDCQLLTQWLLFTVKSSQHTHGARHPRLESIIIETFESAIIVFEVLHSHALWLRRTCGQRVQHHLSVMLRGYKALAVEAKRLDWVAFGLKPKLHAMDHLNKELLRQLQQRMPKLLNPMCYSCEANESVVGHVSRTARRLSSRTVSHTVLDRICVRTKTVIKKFKKQRAQQR